MDPKESLIKRIRATLLSVKGNISLKQANHDFKVLEGEFIPYKQLGYTTLEDLFYDRPEFTISKSSNGEYMVNALDTKASQHITNMVARQKSAKKPASKLYQGRFNKGSSGFGSNNWRKPEINNQRTPQRNISNTYNQQTKYYPPKARPTNNNTYQPKRQGSQKGSPPSAQEQKQHQNQQQSNNITRTVDNKESKTTTCNGTINKTKTQTKLQENKRQQVAKAPKMSATQRLSQLRDKLNTVDMIPLPLPANTDIGPPRHQSVNEKVEAVEELSESATPQERLAWLCRVMKLSEPQYKLHENKPKKGLLSYDCTIKVGNSYTASTYPESTPSESVARDVAALKLCSVLEEERRSKLVVPSTPPALALQRLVELVTSTQAGLWATNLPQIYKETYSETLPSNWEELVKTSPLIVMEKVANERIVLLPASTEQISHWSPSSSLYGEEFTLPPLHFPDEDYWNVFITLAKSTVEVWLRIIGDSYSGAYETMSMEMQAFYNSSAAKPVAIPLENSWYAVNIEEWQRGKVLEILDDGTVSVFLADHGDDEIVSVSSLRVMNSRFTTLPAQAILCRLDGLEEFGSSPQGGDIVSSRIVGQSLVAMAGEQTDNDEPAVPVHLYDTNTLVDVDVNGELIKEFALATTPRFEPHQDLCEVEISCVSAEGRLWATKGWGPSAIRQALVLLTSNGPYARVPPTAQANSVLSRDVLYVVKAAHGEWLRCSIRSAGPDGCVSLRLVDSGRSMRAPATSLVPLSLWSPALAAIPPQAICVRLHNAGVAAGALVGRLQELLIGANVFCRTRTSDAEPSVDLFVRTKPQNMMASVNNAIIMEWNLIKSGKTPALEDKSKETINPIDSLNRKKEKIFSRQGSAQTMANSNNLSSVGISSSILPSVPIPPVGSTFDVYVAMSANPGNFVIQSNLHRKELKDLMKTLQSECPEMSEVSDAVVRGELYAALYEKDDCWYRVTAECMMGGDLVSVSYVDFGDLALVPKSTLRVIPQGHTARKLPAQAIRAQLHNVLPINQDWSVEDCIRFQELAVDKELVAVVKETTPKLSLELIDTTTDDDIYLSSVLIRETRATAGAEIKN